MSWLRCWQMHLAVVLRMQERWTCQIGVQAVAMQGHGRAADVTILICALACLGAPESLPLVPWFLGSFLRGAWRLAPAKSTSSLNTNPDSSIRGTGDHQQVLANGSALILLSISTSANRTCANRLSILRIHAPSSQLHKHKRLHAKGNAVKNAQPTPPLILNRRTNKNPLRHVQKRTAGGVSRPGSSSHT